MAKHAKHTKHTKHAKHLGLSADEVAEFRSFFEVFDKNGDNKIEARELKSVLQNCGQCPTAAEIDKLMADYDINRNGTIEFEEFLKIAKTSSFKFDATGKDELREAFNLFDQNGDGCITRDEVVKMLTGLGEPMTKKEVDDFMKMADINQDGVIDYKEFVRAMCHK